MLPERTIHGENSFSEERKSSIASHRLESIILEVGGRDGLQVGCVHSADGRGALRYRREGFAEFPVTFCPSLQCSELFGVLGVFAKKVRTKDSVRVRVFGRVLAAMLLF